MAIYSIIRVYEVPAVDSKQAIDQMIEAAVMHRDKEYHVKDNTK